MTTKENLKTLLKQNVMNISFKKVDGTERKMVCSLMESIVPPYESKDSTQKKQENENVLPVWDLEKNAFRSVRIESLIEYQIKTDHRP